MKAINSYIAEKLKINKDTIRDAIVQDPFEIFKNVIGNISDDENMYAKVKDLIEKNGIETFNHVYITERDAKKLNIINSGIIEVLSKSKYDVIVDILTTKELEMNNTFLKLLYFSKKIEIRYSENVIDVILNNPSLEDTIIFYYKRKES